MFEGEKAAGGIWRMVVLGSDVSLPSQECRWLECLRKTQWLLGLALSHECTAILDWASGLEQKPSPDQAQAQNIENNFYRLLS